MTTRLQYRPDAAGPIVVTAAGRALVIGADALESPADLLEAIAGADPIAAVLELVGRRGFDAAPDFCWIEPVAEGVWRVLLRGGIPVRVDEAPPLTAEGVFTWTEHRLTGEALAVGAADADGWLPIGDGVVRAAGVLIGASAATTSTPVAAAVESAPAEQQTAVERPATVDATPVEQPAGIEPEPDLPSAPVDADPVAPPAPAAPPAVAVSLPEQTVLPEQTFRGAPDEPASDEPASDEAVAADGSYDFLFGQTVMRSVQDAAVLEDEGSDDVAEPDAAPAGDHDGETVLGASVKALRTAAGPIAAAPRFSIDLSSGGSAEIDGPVIVGRMPSGNASGGVVPQLVTIAGAKDISRSHVRFAVEGDSVVVTDLNSRNGTVLLAPGKAPQQLRASEPTVVLPDTVVDLGGGITLTVREHAG